MLTFGLYASTHWYPACAVCFGAVDSPLTKGLNMGILSLLLVILVVLGCFAKFFLAFRKRAKELI